MCWGFKTVACEGYFLVIVACKPCNVNHLIQSRLDVYATKWILKVPLELSGLWDATMTVLFYWFSLRTFTFGLAPCQCFRLHGVLLGTQKRGWTWLILCSPLACLEGLQRQAVFGLAEHSLAWRCSDWRFHQYWIVMNGSYIRSAHQWLQWQWSLRGWKICMRSFLKLVEHWTKRRKNMHVRCT